MSRKRGLVRNAGDPEQVARAEEVAKNRRETELADVRWLLADPRGRRFFWRYLEQCGVFRTSFTGSSETFFREGARNVGLAMMADLEEADPQAYVTMLTEAKAAEAEEQRLRAAEAADDAS